MYFRVDSSTTRIWLHARESNVALVRLLLAVNNQNIFFLLQKGLPRIFDLNSNGTIVFTGFQGDRICLLPNQHFIITFVCINFGWESRSVFWLLLQMENKN